MYDSTNKGNKLNVAYWFCNTLSKKISGSSRTQSPSRARVRIGIRPQKVAHGSIMGDLLHPVYSADLVVQV